MGGAGGFQAGADSRISSEAVEIRKISSQLSLVAVAVAQVKALIFRPKQRSHSAIQSMDQRLTFV
jgi:hypothetical protein